MKHHHTPRKGTCTTSWYWNNQISWGAGDQDEMHPSEEAHAKLVAEVRNHAVRQHFQDHLCPYVSRMCSCDKICIERKVCANWMVKLRDRKISKVWIIYFWISTLQIMLCVLFSFSLLVPTPFPCGIRPNVYKWIKLFELNF